MRRLNDDRGAIAVIVAVSMVALLSLGAVVIDLGALYKERRELQNGADAAALGIAEDCARGLVKCAASLVGSTAKTYADSNADDSVSAIDGPVALDLVKRKVTVKTATLRPGGGTSILYGFARLFSKDLGKTVHAQATAAWGAAHSAQTLPIAFSAACFTDHLPYGTTRTLTIKSQNPSPLDAICGPANASGSWGYLTPQQGEDPCRPLINIYDSRTDNGADAPDCDLTPFLYVNWKKPVQVPIFDTVTGSGSGAVYRIVGIASFRLDGFNVGGSKAAQGGNSTCLQPSDRCLNGAFVEYVTYDSTITDLPVSSFGTSAISLID